MHSGQCWSKQLPRNLVQLLYTQCARAGGQAGRGEPSHGMQVSHGKWGFEERSKGGIQCYRNSNSTVQSNRSTVAVACTRGYMLRLHARGYTPALHMPRLHDGGYMHEVTYTRLHAEVTCRGYMLRLHAGGLFSSPPGRVRTLCGRSATDSVASIAHCTAGVKSLTCQTDQGRQARCAR